MATQANPVFPPLNPHLRIYIEYSNELWNSAPGFTDQYDYAEQQGNAAADGSPIKYDGMSDGGKPHARFAAMRSAQLSLI